MSRKKEEEGRKERSLDEAGPSRAKRRIEKRIRHSSNPRSGPKIRSTKRNRGRMVNPRFLQGVLSTCSLANTSQINKSKLATIKEKDFRRLATMKHLINKAELRLHKMGVTERM